MRHDQYMKELTPVLEALVKLEATQRHSIVIFSDRELIFETHWSPEASALRDQLHSTLYYIQKQYLKGTQRFNYVQSKS